MGPWTRFPYDTRDYRYDTAALRRTWQRLHAGDAEPWPEDETVQAAWCAYHAGDYQQAVALGLAADLANAGAAPSPCPTRSRARDRQICRWRPMTMADAVHRAPRPFFAEALGCGATGKKR